MASPAEAAALGLLGLYSGSLVWLMAQRSGPESALPSLSPLRSTIANPLWRCLTVPVLGPIICLSQRRTGKGTSCLGLAVVQVVCAISLFLMSDTRSSWAALAVDALAVCVLIAISYVDVRHMLIPNRILVPALILGLVVILLQAALEGGSTLVSSGLGPTQGSIWAPLTTLGVSTATGRLAGCVVSFLVVGALSLCSLGPGGRDRVGMGDVKFAAFCGLLASFPGVFPMLGVTFVLAGAAAALVLAGRHDGRPDTLPLAPILAFATFMAMIT